jgi:CDP-glycerol glycerophosphotransferase (TagB/SpsB family)
MSFISSFFQIIKLKKIKYVFFSENFSYNACFIDLARELSKKSLVVYLFSSKNDIIENENIVNIFIGNGFFRLFVLSFIKCDFFFSTTTDLNKNLIKRNKFIKKYVYVFHSAVSTHKSYTASAFDNYDIILCCGSYQKKEIRKREQLKNLKKKIIIESGFFYFNYLSKFLHDNKNSLSNQKNDLVLFAPSWSYDNNNFFDNFGFELLKKLVETEKVIFRPHPEHLKRSRKTIKKIYKYSLDNSNLFIDISQSNAESIKKSKILITDYSGIALEYILIKKSPVIYFDEFSKIHNTEYFEINNFTIEDNVKQLFGYSLKNIEVFNIISHLKRANNKFNIDSSKIDSFVNKNFYDVKKFFSKLSFFFY